MPTSPDLTALSDRPVTAIVVGASLSGLMTGLALASVGVHVTMLERSDDIGRTGAVISVSDGLLERMSGLTPSRLPRPLAPGLQTWFAVHGALHSAVEVNDLITLRSRTTVLDVGQDEQSAWVRTAEAGRSEADLVIGADGYRSVVRTFVAPGNPDATFAGYVIWLGVADELAVAPTRWPSDVEFLDGETGIVLGYPLPGEDGSVAPGRRRLGWGWIDPSRNDLLHSTGCVDGTVVEHSLLPESIPAATYRDLAAQARRNYPAPWLDAIVGTPIAEYVPDRLVRERVALVGDAAHVSTPMTGMGFSAALDDAEALAAAIAKESPRSGLPAALANYETARLPGCTAPAAWCSVARASAAPSRRARPEVDHRIALPIDTGSQPQRKGMISMATEITEGAQSTLDAVKRLTDAALPVDDKYNRDFVDHDPAAGQPAGGAGPAWFWEQFGTSFSDLDRDVIETIATPTKLITIMNLSGTHTGDFLGHPATGKRFTVRNVQVVGFRDGKSSNRWGSTDELGILQQLGLA